ncbi:hypothetical protein [Thalassococcus sp. S3]|uniref:hypothetical protein n=1 Tax=Thalassococcus sp. S3 TaxID=2017482 RepID=UPI0010247C7D|nr:hypothetical protein [Thalassococcus sp. S3]QBF32158.1 hypothetical protein CFI11_13145 [Thalassococcus sp. S3]
MSTRIPKAWETTWAQEDIKAERDRPADIFRYSEEEQARLNAIRDGAANPEACSDEIVPAPARGALSAFREGYWHEKDGKTEWREVPYRSGCPGRTRDIFDTMTDQAMRRGGKAPFTTAQVGAARDYRALHERVQSAGIRCSRAFDLQAGGHGNADFMEAYATDTRRLAMFHDAIGDGVAKDTKRKVPAMEGTVKVGRVQLRQIGRELITARRLVDDVCIRERALSEVLRAHGWRATGKNRSSLKAALCAALGRMQGI